MFEEEEKKVEDTWPFQLFGFSEYDQELMEQTVEGMIETEGDTIESIKAFHDLYKHNENLPRLITMLYMYAFKHGKLIGEATGILRLGSATYDSAKEIVIDMLGGSGRTDEEKSEASNDDGGA